MASKNGHTEIVKLFLSQPLIELNCRNILHSTIFHKISNSRFHHISFSLQSWYFVLQIYKTPLIYASRNGHIDIVRLLLAQPNIQINCKHIQVHKPFLKFLDHSFTTFIFP